MSTPRDFLTPEECAALAAGDLVYYDGRVRKVVARDAYHVHLRFFGTRGTRAILLTDAPKVLGQFRPREMKLADWRKQRAAVKQTQAEMRRETLRAFGGI